MPRVRNSWVSWAPIEPTATDKSDRITGNETSGLMISLPVHVADPVERARLVALATGIAKEDHEILGPQLYGKMMAYLPTAFAPAAFRWLGLRDAPNKLMNVAVSSVVGPRERGHFGGAAVTEIYSTGVLSPGAPVNITVWSYVDRLGRGAHRRPDVQRPARGHRCHRRVLRRIA